MSRYPFRVLQVLFISAGFLGALSCASSGPSRSESASNPAASLASIFGGRWQGATPGNQLNLNVLGVAIRSLSHPYDLFLEVTGKYQDDNVHEEGYLHLANQGKDVAVGYIPHFDPAVGALSPRAAHFTASEVNAACALFFHPEGDGFVGDTQGSTTCAFAIRGAIGKWTIRIEPGTITVQSQGSGETLKFRRTSRS